MGKELEGRVALVTGSARGIGQAIAKKLSDKGARLVLADLVEAKETAELIGGDPLVTCCDVTKPEDWARVGREIDQKFGRLDILVNNAGIYPQATIDELELEMWRKVFAINTDAVFIGVKEMLPRLRASGVGRIINIGTNSYGRPLGGLSHYFASKMAVIGFVRGLAHDVGGDNITVNTILPSMTNTPGTQGLPEEVYRVNYEQQSIKRMAQPDDIADPVAFLATDAARFITGQSIVVDGGLYKVS